MIDLQKDAPAIKPCPFCSCSGTMEVFENEMFRVGCESINCLGNVYHSDMYFETKREALSKWNNRLYVPDARKRTRSILPNIKKLLIELKIGNVIAVSEHYGVSKSAIYMKLKRYGYNAEDIGRWKRKEMAELLRKL